MKFNYFFILIFFAGCVPTSSSIWEVISVDKEMGNKGVEGNLGINYMINKELKGTMIYISKDSVILNNKNGEIIEATKIIKKETDYYILLGKDEKTIKLEYLLSDENNECTFILSDKSILHTKRIKINDKKRP